MSLIDVGETVYMRAQFHNPVTHAVVVPTSVTFTPYLPNGAAQAQVAGTPDPDVPGGWRAPVTATVAGRWRYKVVSTGLEASVEWSAFEVRSPPL